MRVLILGGGVFLGRHVAEAALERGDRVTLFSRGRTQPALFPGVERLIGDRDGDLSALQRGEWDAVIDTSGFVPRIVRRLRCAACAPRAALRLRLDHHGVRGRHACRD
jgi:2'-hydroxyisoflavone reductase